jgi:hypothetical protein
MTGDDANDGRTKSVLTLKRAIEISVTNTEINTIFIATGASVARNGEMAG